MYYSKKLLSSLLSIFVLLAVIYMAVEPAMTLAYNAGPDSATITATVTGEIDISSPTDTAFTTTIPGMTGNPGSPATASLAWTVITNNAAGFTMSLKAGQVDALQLDASNVFSDASLTPSFGWTAASAGSATFGFTISSATAADTVAAFRDGGAACGAGANTGGCWSGFNSTTGVAVVSRSSNTAVGGEVETVNFKAESNGKFLKSGTTYTATITATVAQL